MPASDAAALTEDADRVGVAVVEALGVEDGVAYSEDVCTAPNRDRDLGGAPSEMTHTALTRRQWQQGIDRTLSR
jgi:hypothetical protein